MQVRANACMAFANACKNKGEFSSGSPARLALSLEKTALIEWLNATRDSHGRCAGALNGGQITIEIAVFSELGGDTLARRRLRCIRSCD